MKNYRSIHKGNKAQVLKMIVMLLVVMHGCAKKVSLDHFKVYNLVSGIDVRSLPITVDLYGQFDHASTHKVDTIQYMIYFANPVLKDSSKYYDKNAHLLWYSIAAQGDSLKEWYQVKNQFRIETFMIGKAQYLLLPAEKHIKGSTPPKDLDHFKCYEIIKYEPKDNAPRMLEDQFFEELTEIGLPKYFCVPVEKDVGEGHPSTELFHPELHLLVYEIHNTIEGDWPVRASDQFSRDNPYEFTAKKGIYLCVPSWAKKKAEPPPTPKLTTRLPDIVAESDLGACGTNVAWSPSIAIEPCEIKRLVYSHQPSDFFPVGETHIIYTVTDSCDNVFIDTFSLTVIDINEPEIVCIADTLYRTAENDSCGATIIIPAMWSTAACTEQFLWNSHTGTSDPSGFYPVGLTEVTAIKSNKDFPIDGIALTDTCDFVVCVVPRPLSGTITAKHLSCNEQEGGSLHVTLSRGCPPYAIAWSPATGSQTGETATGLTPGTYQVTITDTESQILELSGFILSSGTLLIDSLVSNDVKCPGASDGFVEVFVDGGTKPYAYSWNTGGTHSRIDNLSAGTYEVTVMDSDSCTGSGIATILEPPAIETMVSGTNVTTPGASDGSATLVEVSGGTAPYRFLWSNGDTTKTITNIPAGFYEITVIDAQGCPAVNFVEIN